MRYPTRLVSERCPAGTGDSRRSASVCASGKFYRSCGLRESNTRLRGTVWPVARRGLNLRVVVAAVLQYLRIQLSVEDAGKMDSIDQIGRASCRERV